MDRLLRSSPTNRDGTNYPQDSIILTEEDFIDILSVECVENYKLHIFFSNGKDRVVDFEPFLRLSLNPLIQKYLDPERFKDFTVQDGDLFWNDYDLCFPVADLYEGKL